MDGESKFKFNYWIIISIILAVALVFVIAKGSSFGITGFSALDSDEVAEKALDYLNNILTDEQKAKLIEITEKGDLYNIKFEVGGQLFDSYATKDGELLFLNAIDLNEAPMTTEEDTVPKADRPKVELFVMTHCPYGTQAEKALLPVWELLEDKADFSINFVYYAMHGQEELDESLRQYCIQKEQNDKFTDYLTCFLKEGKSENCLDGIDTAKLDACISATDEDFKVTENFNDQTTWINDRFPALDLHKELNEKYSIQGSPTFVINGKVVSVARNPEAIKTAICNAFNTAPEECSEMLSTASASPGFGEGSGGSEGSCA